MLLVNEHLFLRPVAHSDPDIPDVKTGLDLEVVVAAERPAVLVSVAGLLEDIFLERLRTFADREAEHIAVDALVPPAAFEEVNVVGRGASHVRDGDDTPGGESYADLLEHWYECLAVMSVAGELLVEQRHPVSVHSQRELHDGVWPVVLLFPALAQIVGFIDLKVEVTSIDNV